MAQGSDFVSPTRRGFLATTGGALAGAVAASHPLNAAAAPQGDNSNAKEPMPARKKILIGVFDPAFPDLTIDQLDRMAGRQSDTGTAKTMQQAKAKLFAGFAQKKTA